MKEKSKCCNAYVIVRGGCEDRGHSLCSRHHTMYYECSKCNKSCDVILETSELQKKQIIINKNI